MPYSQLIPSGKGKYRTTTQQAYGRRLNTLTNRAVADRERMDAGMLTMGTDESLANTAAEARGYANTVFDSHMGTVGREQQVLGGLTERQEMAQKKRVGLRRSLAEVATANRAIVGEQDRSMAVDEAKLDRRDMYEEMSMSTLNTAAGIENRRNADRKIRSAQRSASAIGALGTVAGIGLAAFTGGASLALVGATAGGGGG